MAENNGREGHALRYRADVDGLRALAVIPVVLFHASPRLIPGGFVGVDIFFVISGYLISGIILKALSAGSFSFMEFYARRAKRIFPALIIVLFAVALFGWLISLPGEYLQLGEHIVTGAGFVLNINLFLDTNPYFGEIGTPLVHLWSLGVEEQFYLFWPVFLFAIAKTGRWQLQLLFGVIFVSFAANVAAVASDPLKAFFLPVTRLWELALGGALAFLKIQIFQGPDDQLRSGSGSVVSHISATVGLLLILGSYAGLNMAMRFPGWLALLPCLGAGMLIAAGPSGWVNRYVLAAPIMVFVGLISYPLYLWHWPVLSFVHTMDWRSYTPQVQSLAVLLSVVLAYLTYRFVERPVRAMRQLRPLAAGLTAALGGVAVIGLLIATGRIESRPVPEHIIPFVNASSEEYPFPEKPGFLRIGNPAASKQVLFIGDSTVGQYHSRIDRLLEERPFHSHNAVFAWRPGCAPDIEVTRIDKEKCQALLAEAVEYGKQDVVDTIVLGFCWYPYFTGNRDPDRVGEGRLLVSGTQKALDNVKRIASDFVNQGKRVYVILHAPLDPGYAPLQMIKRTISGSGFELDVRRPERSQISQAFEPFLKEIRNIANEAGAEIIDPMQALCDDKHCPSVDEENAPIYRDMFHLRKDYVRESVEYLDGAMHFEGKVT